MDMATESTRRNSALGTCVRRPARTAPHHARRLIKKISQGCVAAQPALGDQWRTGALRVGSMVMKKSRAKTERVDSRPQPTRGESNMDEERKEAFGRLRGGKSLSSRHLDLILRSPNGMLVLAQMGWFTPT